MQESPHPSDSERRQARERDMILLDIDMRQPNTLQKYAQRHIAYLAKNKRPLYGDVMYQNTQN